ncbi:sodium:calcium antiporter [Chloroflexota bacterium]
MVCILIILYFGRRVAIYGDVIAEKTGLGGVWTGLILLAVVTSLPEFFTGVSSIVLVGAPDLTIGNLFGANAFNLFNLAILDIAYKGGPLLGTASLNHRVTALCSLILILVAAVSIFVSQFVSLGIGWIGWYTPVIIALYVFFVRQLFKREQRQPSPPPAPLDGVGISSRRVYTHFAISAIFIIGAGIWLATIGEEITLATGWGESLVGSLFLGFTTTLPEFTVSLAAMRIGAVDMAVANMIGSNLFNMTIISIDDLIYTRGPILAHVATKNIIIAGAAILLTALFIIGFRFKARKRFRLSWWNLSLIALFAIGFYLNFTLA